MSRVEHTDPTGLGKPTTGFQEEGQMVAQSLHKKHDHHGDKYKNLCLALVRLIIFLGDSNVGRLPPIDNGNVEVDYYSGVNLAQAYHIIKHKTPVSLVTQHVILLFAKCQHLHCAVGRDGLSQMRQDAFLLLSVPGRCVGGMAS